MDQNKIDFLQKELDYFHKILQDVQSCSAADLKFYEENNLTHPYDLAVLQSRIKLAGYIAEHINILTNDLGSIVHVEDLLYNNMGLEKK